MPRARKPSASANSVSSSDLAEFQAALAGTLQATRVNTFPAGDLAALAQTCVDAGYTLVISPQMDGRAVRLSVPVGTDRLAIVAGTDQELEEATRALILLVRKLPRKQ